MSEEIFEVNSTILGSAAEHYVMSRLLRRNMIAALAPAGVPNCDIVVTDATGNRLCAIQVKARRNRGNDGGWHMKEKHEHLTSPQLFYVFVDFGDEIGSHPSSWIIPSKVVADVVSRSHKVWLSQPGRHGKERKDSKMRRFLPDYSKHPMPERLGWLDPYSEAWALLGSTTDNS